jgi:hypothetical protein
MAEVSFESKLSTLNYTLCTAPLSRYSSCSGLVIFHTGLLDDWLLFARDQFPQKQDAELRNSESKNNQNCFVQKKINFKLGFFFQDLSYNSHLMQVFCESEPN